MTVRLGFNDVRGDRGTRRTELAGRWAVDGDLARPPVDAIYRDGGQRAYGSDEPVPHPETFLQTIER
jgi:hypothetical protein